MRAALDAAAQLFTVAAGGANAVMTFPFARSHLRELARYRFGPSAPATRETWLAHLRQAWRDIDAAVAALPEIRFDARRRGESLIPLLTTVDFGNLYWPDFCGCSSVKGTRNGSWERPRQDKSDVRASAREGREM